MDNDAVFHAGEQAAQARAGVAERIAQIGPALIRNFMPEQHRELFEKLPMVVAGSLDERRRPWASILVGRPGFVSSPDERTLRVDARPLPGDPLAANLRVGAQVALLGIELETRRRNRMNGLVAATTAHGFSVRVQQSFGNCPKYIQVRGWRWIDESETPGTAPPVQREGSSLSPAARALVERADTFFIASATPDTVTAADEVRATSNAASGVDVSHRGGRPGFVRVTDASGTTLTIPDLLGNFLFNTLGNLMVHPHAGLLFVDFESGMLLG